MKVVHHPGDHCYVRHIGHGRPCSGRSIWDVAGLRRDRVDVVHLHFGFERWSPDELEGWAQDLADAGIALAYTVHDVDNPHLTDQRDHHRAIGTLMARAHALTTLTEAAADVLQCRHGRRPLVLAHPHVVPLREMACRHRAPRPRRGVYVHAATGRPNLDLDAIACVALAAAPPDVLVHVRPEAPPATIDALDRLARRGRLILDVRPRLGDDELWDRLAAAELVLLPYRWGTHSGLLEAAHDLGTPVLAPAFGGFADQGAHVYHGDPAARIAAAMAAPPTVTVEDRLRGRRRLRAAHRCLHGAAVRSLR
jgi:glycosyltransferase involved in cell wall biosynthesis